MKYQVLESFKVKTSQGEMELQTGQIIILSKENAIKLLNEGKISPVQKVAYKVYSKILHACLWVVADDEELKALRVENNHDPAYTHEEIQELKGMNPEGLKAIHKVKEVFPESSIEKISKRGGF